MFKLKYKASPPSFISHIPYCMCQVGRPPLFRMEESPSVLLWGMVVKSVSFLIFRQLYLWYNNVWVSMLSVLLSRSFLVPFRIDQKNPDFASICDALRTYKRRVRNSTA